jgi:hypothetical protein
LYTKINHVTTTYTSLPTTTSFPKRNKCFALARTDSNNNNNKSRIGLLEFLSDEFYRTRKTLELENCLMLQENLIKILDLTKETQLPRLEKWRRIV